MEFKLPWFVGGTGREAQSTGAWGERLAAQYLRKTRHFSVLAMNWRSPADHRLELDLVCSFKELLIFVEVKTRRAGSLQRGYEAVNRRKRRALLDAARAYLRALPAPVRPLAHRFDVVEVVHGGDGLSPELLHFENVPLFPQRRLA